LILLDENALGSQRESLEARRLPVSKVGFNWGRRGMSDEEILTGLRETRQVTFFTRDVRLYRRHFCHPRYCLVVVERPEEELAEYALPFLRHPSFRTHRDRMGKVVRLKYHSIVYRAHERSTESFRRWID
jgi:hypothetical protein